MNLIIKTYFQKNANDMHIKFRNEKLGFNGQDIIDWLRSRPNAGMKIK